MNRPCFDNAKYVKLQSQNIRDRISQFGKLYLEFGGKLFDDYHASRVLPGFEPDSKVKMLLEMKDEAEIVIAISADDIERSKRRGDLGITYEDDTLRLIDAFRGIGLYIGSVVITHYRGQAIADQFIKRLAALGVRTYKHYIIPDYPSNISLIVSPEGFGKNDYIETERSLVVVKHIYEHTTGRFPIIGCGGIMSPAPAAEMLSAGASLIQLHTGLVYEGPKLVKKILKYLVNHPS